MLMGDLPFTMKSCESKIDFWQKIRNDKVEFNNEIEFSEEVKELIE